MIKQVKDKKTIFNQVQFVQQTYNEKTNIKYDICIFIVS